MKPLGELTEDAARGLRAIFTDIDDTLTTGGRLGPAAYGALWRLRDAGLLVVPVTGRPAGWADPIARLWPVAGVVAENGAVAFWLDEGGNMCRWYARPPKEMKADQARLLELAFAIVRDNPACRIAADQAFRISDVAVDFAEEVGPLGLDVAEGIRRRFVDGGATAKISSIHVNAWQGEHDKATSCARFARERLGLDVSTAAAAYVGDSPNDEPLFARFALSFGVANVVRFAGRLRHEPTFLASSACGEGFAEIADRILALRKGPVVDAVLGEGDAAKKLPRSGGRTGGRGRASRSGSGRGPRSGRRP
ncbi:MAG: HAD-IIB family hydrolase [Deltaproteobacteria bacterium]|nr:HAD-IIB family hydrolase [Deltaproteobacteria bacterium]